VVVYFSTATKRRSRGASWSIIAPPFILRAPVLPKYLQDTTTELLRHGNITRDWVADPSKNSNGLSLMQPDECSEWAEKNLPAYASKFWASEHAGTYAVSFRSDFVLAEHRCMRAMGELNSFTSLTIERDKRELDTLRRLGEGQFLPRVVSYFEITKVLRTGQDITEGT
jgi:hypothetical protein